MNEQFRSEDFYLANAAGEATKADVEALRAESILAQMQHRALMGKVEQVESESESKFVAVATPVTRIPLAFTFRTDEPEETTVNCPAPGEKNPVCWSPTKNIDGDTAEPGEKDTFVTEVIIPTLKGAASTQNASVPYPTTLSS